MFGVAPDFVEFDQALQRPQHIWMIGALELVIILQNRFHPDITQTSIHSLFIFLPLLGQIAEIFHVNLSIAISVYNRNQWNLPQIEIAKTAGPVR